MYQHKKTFFIFILLLVHILGCFYFNQIPPELTDSFGYYNKGISPEIKSSNITKIVAYLHSCYSNITYLQVNYIFSFFSFLALFLFIQINQYAIFKYFFLSLFFFSLPNLHVWTGSINKEALLLLVLALIFLIGKYNFYLTVLVIPFLFLIRPHYAGFISLSYFVLFLYNLKLTKRSIFLFTGSLILFLATTFYFLKYYLNVPNINYHSIVKTFYSWEINEGYIILDDFQNRFFLIKLFSILYMPIFDSISLKNIIISFESLIIGSVFIFFANKEFYNWIKSTKSINKLFFVFAIIALFFLCILSNNLGHLLRQKSVPIFILFYIFILFNSETNLVNYYRNKWIKQ